MRINRYLAESGCCSRRKADQLIAEGRVMVNGTLAELGTQVEDGSRVEVDGKPVGEKQEKIYILLNKPRGVECTADSGTVNNVVAYIGIPERIYPVGRLDKESEGMLFLTNDGDFADFIMRAANHHEKEYEVRVDYPVNSDFIRAMGSGVDLEGRMTRPCKVIQTGTDRFTIILTQGMNRQIRRMCEVLGYRVRVLRRVRILNMTAGKLNTGQWRHLTLREVESLYLHGK